MCNLCSSITTDCTYFLEWRMNMKRCKKCGQLENELTKFCTSCGSSMKDAEVVNQEVKATCCPNCGKPANDTYCQYCGTLVNRNNAAKTNSQKGPSFVSGTKKPKKMQNYLVPVIGLLFIGIVVFIICIGKNQTVPNKEGNNIESTAQITKEECTTLVRYGENGKIGYKAKEGNIILEAKYINAGDFTENGLARVVGENHFWGYMDYNGKMVIEPQFELAYDFQKNGLARVADAITGEWGYINEEGDYVIEPQFESVDEFQENGLACVADATTEEWGYINEKGDYVINPQFDYAFSFDENGLAYVKDEATSKYGYIDTEGNYIIEPQYYDVGIFYNGEAMVRQDEKWVYINAKGEYVADVEEE